MILAHSYTLQSKAHSSYVQVLVEAMWFQLSTGAYGLQDEVFLTQSSQQEQAG